MGRAVADGPLTRRCPKCDAPIGWRCAKWISVDGIRYRDHFLIYPHRERVKING